MLFFIYAVVGMQVDIKKFNIILLYYRKYTTHGIGRGQSWILTYFSITPNKDNFKQLLKKEVSQFDRKNAFVFKPKKYVLP